MVSCRFYRNANAYDTLHYGVLSSDDLLLV